jgi:uncharacterized membrane protein
VYVLGEGAGALHGWRAQVLRAASAADGRVRPVPLKHIALERRPFSDWASKVHRILFALFLIQWTVVWSRLWLPHPPFVNARWPNGLLVVLAAATLMASLARRLPGQNVLLAAAIIAMLGGGVETLGILIGVPFGPFTYTDAMGQKILHVLPWAVPMMWIVALLVSRGVARLAVRPWRKSPNYGYWLLGVTGLLVVMLDLALEPFATKVELLWKWAPSRLRLDWYTAPCVSFLGRGVTAVMILAFVTPALINKKPVKPPPPDCDPLVVWVLLNLLFATGAVVNHLWPAVAVTAAANVALVGFAIRGALHRE